MKTMITNIFTTETQHHQAGFGFFSDAPKQCYLFQVNQDKVHYVPFNYRDVQATVAVLEALTRIMETDLLYHICNPTKTIEIRWLDNWLFIKMKELDVEISIKGKRDEPAFGLGDCIENLINAMYDWMHVLEGSLALDVCTEKFRLQTKTNSPDRILRTVKFGGSAFGEMTTFWVTNSEPERVTLTIGNRHEIFQKSVTEEYLGELLAGFEGIKKFSDSLPDGDGEGNGIQFGFKSEFSISGLLGIVYTEPSRRRHNCMLVNQTYNHNSRISFTADREDLDYIQTLLTEVGHFGK